MVERVLAASLKEHVGSSVRLAGWVRSTRELGKLVFVHVADRSGIVQCVFKGELADQAKQLGLEDVIMLEGTVKADERVPLGAEIGVTALEIVSVAARPLPVDVQGKTKTNFDARFDHRVLDLRGERQQAIFKVQHSLVQGFRSYLDSQGFIEVRSPKIIATGTEGGANLFPVVYFDREAFLAQSPQFYKQMLVGSGFERVYEVAPVFRAEEHDTPFHLNEYISLDLEFGFIKDEEDVMRMCQGAFKSMFASALAKNKRELEYFGVDWKVPEGDFPIIHFWEIPDILAKYGEKFEPTNDLSRKEEELLCKHALEKHGSHFVFIDNYPASKRPAYTMPYEKDARFTRGFDLLFDGLEVVTGGQRIHNYEMLKQKFKEKGFPVDAFEFYMEVFKFGMPPHGGMAIGLERLTMKMLKMDNVREAAYFPRDRKRLYP